jgi:soluble lytic murein transglycosylase-like protein
MPIQELNFKKTRKYGYYFDSKFTNYRIIKPFLAVKRVVVLALIAAVALTGLFYYIGLQSSERRELASLKRFIVAYTELNNINDLSASDYDLLAREVKKASQKYDIDPMLVLSVITVESSFDKDAVSSKGAIGLMQLMPHTAKDLCLEMGMSERNCKVRDVKTNILVGTYYLSKLSAKYNNNMKHYLAAYNCGPTMIDRVISSNDRVPTQFYSRIMKVYQKLAI